MKTKSRKATFMYKKVLQH